LFRSGETYTASVTLTAHENYIFAGAFTSNATINTGSATAVISNGGATATLSRSFVTTGVKTANGMTIKTSPNLIYTHDNLLNLSALVVTLDYDDLTSADILFDDFGDHGLSTNYENGLSLSFTLHNGQAIRVTHNVVGFRDTAGLNISRAPGAAVSTFTVGNPKLTSVDITAAELAGSTEQSIEFAYNLTGVTPTSWSDLGTTFPVTISGQPTDRTIHVFIRSKGTDDYLPGTPATRTISTVAPTDSELVFVFTPIAEGTDLKLPPGMNESDFVLSISGNTSITLALTIAVDNNNFDWFVNGKPAGDKTGTFVLRLSHVTPVMPNTIHSLTAEVEIGGIPYNLTIPFTVVE